MSEVDELDRKGTGLDPFDRLLVSQAIANGWTIGTPDPAIRAYPVATLWE